MNFNGLSDEQVREINRNVEEITDETEHLIVILRDWKNRMPDEYVYAL